MIDGAKRAFDLLFACVGLVLLSPFLGVLAVMIKLDSPGPVLYRQERVGRHGRLFRIYKLRSMSVGTAAKMHITKFGRTLRRHKLDELPQLINVVKGEMSLVGPRPELPTFVALYSPPDRDQILSVRPGITDLASIEYIDEDAMLASAADPERLYIEQIMPAKLELSLRYLQKRSLTLDAVIILRTVCRLFRQGQFVKGRQRGTAANNIPPSAG